MQVGDLLDSSEEGLWGGAIGGIGLFFAGRCDLLLKEFFEVGEEGDGDGLTWLFHGENVDNSDEHEEADDQGEDAGPFSLFGETIERRGGGI